MKLLSRILNGSSTHPLPPPQRGHEMVTSAVIPPRPETAPAPPPVASGARLVHWLETAVKFGTPIGTIACDSLACDDTVVTVRLDDVTCRKCRDAIDASVIAPVQAEPELAVPSCTATTSKGARCKFRAEPGSDRCAMPAHSHERQP